MGPKLPDKLYDSPKNPGHGSCVAAKVMGTTVGVTKNAKVVVTSLKADEFMDASWLDGLLKIYDAIISKGNGEGGKDSAVVNTSILGFRMNTGRFEQTAQWDDAVIQKMGKLYSVPARF